MGQPRGDLLLGSGRHIGMNWRLIGSGTDILVCYYFDWRCDRQECLSYVCEK